MKWKILLKLPERKLLQMQKNKKQNQMLCRSGSYGAGIFAGQEEGNGSFES